MSLETCEMMEQPFLLKPQQYVASISRKLYSENVVHALYASKIDLSLHIPRKATPHFQTSIGKLQWRIRLEFIIQGRNQSILVPQNRAEGFFGFTRHLFGDEESVGFQHSNCVGPAQSSCLNATFP